MRGKVSALLELGSGFNPEFTGRENVIIERGDPRLRYVRDASAPGSDRAVRRDRQLPGPTGQDLLERMFMRLAFAVAVNVDPDILLVDEALAVGELIFQHRCMHRMNQLRASGKTIVLVTHDLGAVTKFCNRALLLDAGRLAEDGAPDRVVQKYRALIFERERRYGAAFGEAAAAEGSIVTDTGDGAHDAEYEF